MTHDMDEFCRLLLARGAEAGFEASEVFYQDGSSFRVSIYKGEVDDYRVSGTRGLGFRGLLGGRCGYAYTQAFDDEAIEFLIENAKQSAQLVENDDPQFIYAGDASYPTVDVFNPALEAVTAAQKIERAFELERAVLAHKESGAPIDQCTAEVATGRGLVRIVNSRGLNLSHEGNYATAVAEVIVKDGERANTGFAYKASNRFEDCAAEDVAREAVEEAMASLGARSVPSGTYRVVLRNDRMVDLISAFDNCFSADAAQKGLSLLKGKEGQEIAAKVVTLTDDPLRPDGFSSTPFDDEGVAARTKNIIENGTLVTLLHNLKTAAKQGVETTGNAHRASFSSPVGVAASNLYLQPGTIARDELLARLGEGLYITELQGLHSGANAITGDFSLAAKGFLVEGGRQASPVEQITIAGNFFAVLRSIVALADDLWFAAGGVSIGSPSVLVDGVSVAGL